MTSLKNESPESSYSLLRRLLPVSFALALTLTFGTADAWAKANVAPPSTGTPPAESAETTAARSGAESSQAPSTPLDDDLANYTQREAQARSLEGFHGGDVLVITSSGLAIVLLVILLVILL